MIETKGNYIKTKHTKKEIIDLCNLMINETKKSFSHFVELLGINKDLFSHLLNIKLIVDYTEESSEDKYIAFYVSEDEDENNNIHISPLYLDKMLTYIENNGNKKGEYEDWLNELTSTLIHEVIHANRDVMVKNGIHTFKLLEQSRDNYINRSRNSKLKEDLDRLLIDNINAGNHHQVILLKVIDRPNYYETYVYNNKNKCYEVYNLSKSNLYNKDYSKVFKDIESYLNLFVGSSLIKMTPKKRINSVIDDDFIGGIADFTSDDGIDISKLSNSELADLNRLVVDQIGLEESLTEALTDLIIYHKDKNELDIHGFYLKVSSDNSTSIDIKISSKLLDRMSIDDIRWFMLASYSESFENRFKNIFKSDYDTFIHNMYEIYNSVLDDEEYDKSLVEENEEIIERRVK